jgi:hypothetical protein
VPGSPPDPTTVVLPKIDGASLTPPDFGNTAFTQQPIAVRIAHDAPGTAAISRIVINLKDETAGTSQTFSSGGLLEFDPVSGWATTPPVDLTQGHVYRVKVLVEDALGNETVFEQSPANVGGGFLATSASANGTSASIPPTGCRVSDEVDIAGMKLAVCPNVPLELEQTSIAIGGSRGGPYTSYVEQELSLDGAFLTTTSGETLQEQRVPAFPPRTERTVSMKYAVPEDAASGTIGIPEMSEDAGTVRVMVPGEWKVAHISMPAAPTTASLAACPNPAESSSPVACTTDPFNHQYIVVLDGPLQPALSAQVKIAFEYDSALNGFAASIPFPEAERLYLDPRVIGIVRDFIFVGPELLQSPVPSPSGDAIPTGVNRINAEAKANDGYGIVVAIVDSGINAANHPDLQDQVGTAYNCSQTGTTQDGTGHGTSVAGIIGAAKNNIGIVGVGGQIGMVSVKIFNNDGLASAQNSLCGIDRVSYHSRNVVHISAANLSWGHAGAVEQDPCGQHYSGFKRTIVDPLHYAICGLTSQGTQVVASAGNDGTDLATYAPATYQEVIAVTALKDYDGLPCGAAAGAGGVDDTFWSESNYASHGDQVHTVAAPGGVTNILTTASDGTYRLFGGTSAAAPHVTGAVALYANSGGGSQGAIGFLKSTGEYLNQNRDCAAVPSHTDPSGLHPEPVIRLDNL